LADRYAEFRNYDLKQKGQVFDYRSFYDKVIKDFKSGGFFQIPQTRFFDLIEYFQLKINRTILAKVNKSKGITRNFDTYEEYKMLNSFDK